MMNVWVIIIAVCTVVDFGLATVPDNKFKLLSMVAAVCGAFALGLALGTKVAMT